MYDLKFYKVAQNMNCRIRDLREDSDRYQKTWRRI